MKLAASSLFLLLNLFVQAQPLQKITISGIANPRTPVQSADCFLKNNEHVGTLTDASGYFLLAFPQSMMYDTLVIWAMGFEKKEVPLSSIDLHQDTVYFYLDKQSIVLNEVLIESTGLDLKSMVLKALARLPNNYPNKRHQLKGLYRKVSTMGAQFTHLEEAAIVVEDDGYGKLSTLVKIKTEQYRQTKDWGDIDSLFIIRNEKMHRAISQQLKNPTNPLNRLYESNRIRHYNGENAWFNFKKFRNIIHDHYTFELVDISLYDGDTLYHLALGGTPVPPPPKHVSGRNYLKINGSDLAIVEMQFTLGSENEPLMNQDHVKFEKKDGKYYPKYVRNIAYRHINSKVNDDEYDIRTFWFDEVKLKDFQRITPSEANDPNDSHSHKRSISSATFWDSTSLIKRHPLEQSVKDDLQKHAPLEAQFSENGKN